jgi:urease accessory protein
VRAGDGAAAGATLPIVLNGADNKVCCAPARILWQLADSALPTGGFAHSGGVEAAAQYGEAPPGAGLESYLRASLWHAGRGLLPFFAAAHDAPESLSEIDEWCDATLSNHVANRASRQQGRAMDAAGRRIFGVNPPAPPCGHYAPVFGAVARLIGVGRAESVQLFLFNHLRGVVAAAVRLGVAGPMEAQSMQLRLGPELDAVAEACGRLNPADAAQTSPLVDLWQGGHDRLYSRLFQS